MSCVILTDAQRHREKQQKSRYLILFMENTAITMEVFCTFSYYSFTVTAFELQMFKTFLTERVKGNVRAVLTEMEFK